MNSLQKSGRIIIECDIEIKAFFGLARGWGKKTERILLKYFLNPRNLIFEKLKDTRPFFYRHIDSWPQVDISDISFQLKNVSMNESFRDLIFSVFEYEQKT